MKLGGSSCNGEITFTFPDLKFSCFLVLYILSVLEEESRDSKVLANLENKIQIKAFVCSREKTEDHDENNEDENEYEDED